MRVAIVVARIQAASVPRPSARKGSREMPTSRGRPPRMPTNRSRAQRSGRVSSQASGLRSGRASTVAATSSSTPMAVEIRWPVDSVRITSDTALNMWPMTVASGVATAAKRNMPQNNPVRRRSTRINRTAPDRYRTDAAVRGGGPKDLPARYPASTPAARTPIAAATPRPSHVRSRDGRPDCSSIATARPASHTAVNGGVCRTTKSNAANASTATAAARPQRASGACSIGCS